MENQKCQNRHWKWQRSRGREIRSSSSPKTLPSPSVKVVPSRERALVCYRGRKEEKEEILMKKVCLWLRMRGIIILYGGGGVFAMKKKHKGFVHAAESRRKRGVI